MIEQRKLAIPPGRVIIAKMIAWSFVFCIFFGILSIVFYRYADIEPLCEVVFPKFSALSDDSSKDFCLANNIMWTNIIVLSICYGATYVISIPIWVIFAVSRSDWSDWRFKVQSSLFIGMVLLCSFLEIYSYLFGSPGYFGVYPKLTDQTPLYEYVRFQVVALMGIANFLLFGGTMFVSGKIFGRGANRSYTRP